MSKHSSTAYPDSRSPFLPEPEVDAERRATFRVHAPNAREVKIINQSDAEAMGAEEYELEKGDDGVWTVTTEPCRPGLHYYKLSIDGFECADPRNHVYFGWARWSSCLEVPDPELDFYEPKGNPSGDIHLHWYPSTVTGTTRKCLVYTPPEYRGNPSKHYPALYLQHGSGESEMGWTMQGRTNFILDNLIAEERAVPMIVVMDNGYAPAPETENPRTLRGTENQFEETLLKDLIPNIDATFRTLKARDYRALAGLSMGRDRRRGSGSRTSIPFPGSARSAGDHGISMWKRHTGASSGIRTASTNR